ncbi:MAG: ketol-acid reductoisomerase [Candidatus Zixiibacteriota bacterium]|nr:MAG: ketol-acid reductoisomerase [candidate division Zixibacteria bacterium]
MRGKDLHSKIIAILGYGSQGRAIALNLRDSGYDVVMGLRSRSGSRRIAQKDGFIQIHTVSRAVAKSDIVCFAFPDHLHGRVYKKDIEKYLSPNSTLWFLHGMSIHFRFIVPPENCDVILIAPHAPGAAVREKYLSKSSLSAFYAVHRDSSGRALKTTFELARAVGINRRGLAPTSFEAEAVGDLFGEQAVLCGGMAALIKSGFEVLVENGIPPENAYLEVAYQLDLIIDLIKQYGIEGMFKRISVAARYGSLLSGPKIIDESVKKRMARVYREIQSGRFPRKLNRLESADILRINRELKSLSSPLLERAIKRFSD